VAGRPTTTTKGLAHDAHDDRAPPTVTPFRWTRARYDFLAETDILGDTHCELLDGQIVETDVTISPRHAHTVHQTGS
jgi:hypothetical protein